MSYLWAYNGQYPVAEIQNADATEVLTALGGTTFTQMADITDSPTIKTTVDAVRTALPNALVTTYQYNATVGISAMADPAAKNLTYGYDPYGRLIAVSNNAGPLRASYCYNYAGQAVNCDEILASGTINPEYISLITNYSPPLPVTLINFNAIKEQTSALLAWNTTEEINSKVFEVERSQNGRNWFLIGSVESHGNSDKMQYYSFIDKSPSHGENLYRLKMIDHDNTFAYSRIESLTFNIGASVYPNPVTVGGKLTLETSGNITQVKIYDVQGKAVYAQNNPGRQIDVSSLQVGVYIVQVTASNGLVTTHRIVKQ